MLWMIRLILQAGLLFLACRRKKPGSWILLYVLEGLCTARSFWQVWFYNLQPASDHFATVLWGMIFGGIQLILILVTVILHLRCARSYK